MRISRIFGWMLLSAPAALAAQDAPPYVPLNPALAARSALYAQPFMSRSPGWHTRVVADYSNAVEVSTATDARQYAFDAEILQADLWLTRDLSRNVFVLGNVAFRGAHAGFLDGFLNWYHDLIGFRVPARNQRTENRFDWDFELGGDSIVRERATLLGDLRVGAGVRLSERLQLLTTVTLPTATTTAEGWSRKTIGTSVALIARPMTSERVVLDVATSVGWTPTHGDLARFQRSAFVSAMTSLRWRFTGAQALYATAWAQSPNWHDTDFGALDRAEVTLDFGGLFQLGRGLPQLQVGMTEDLMPNGPAIDAGFKLGVRW